jgi:P22 coat protein - gene protein 5.
MSNTILTPTIYTMECLRILENNLVFAKNASREYDPKFGVSGAKIGYTLNIRRPARYTVSTGAALDVQDYTETSIPLTLTTQAHVDTTFTTADMTVSLDEFSDRVLKPVMPALANKVDFDGLVNAQNTVGQHVGTPGTLPATAAAILAAGQMLDEHGTPRDGQRSAVFDPASQAALIGGLSGLFNSQSRLAEQFEQGEFVDARATLGFLLAMDQNVSFHTVGALGGTPAVNGGSQGITSGWANTTSLVTDGWTAAAAQRLNAGDIFTIAGVYSVNPQNRTTTGQLQQFVVTADASSDGSGNLTAVISPAIISDGAFQNVTAAPADGALITVVGTAATAYRRNLAYHKDAFRLGTADLIEVSQFGAWGARKNYKGISMRVARQYLIATDTVPCRTDILYGWGTVYQELATQVAG